MNLRGNIASISQSGPKCFVSYIFSLTLGVFFQSAGASASIHEQVNHIFLHKPTLTKDKYFLACLFPGPGGARSSWVVLLDRDRQGVQPVF